MLEIHFHAVLQKMLVKSASCVLKINCFVSYGWTDTVATVTQNIHYAADMLKDAMDATY